MILIITIVVIIIVTVIMIRMIIVASILVGPESADVFLGCLSASYHGS